MGGPDPPVQARDRAASWAVDAPAGFMDSARPSTGRLRETLEEANARVELASVLASVGAHVDQVHVFYRAGCSTATSPGRGNLEIGCSRRARFLEGNRLPQISTTLRHFYADRKAGRSFSRRRNPAAEVTRLTRATAPLSVATHFACNDEISCSPARVGARRIDAGGAGRREPRSIPARSSTRRTGFSGRALPANRNFIFHYRLPRHPASC